MSHTATVFSGIINSVLKIVIDNSRCDGCMLCLAACGQGGLLLTTTGIAHDEKCDCHECRKCEYICARGAIFWSYEITTDSTTAIK
ncbi:MAG: hypothetical protein E4H31_02690 [Dehalococcoidia bacterium]|nr:MAG: hypothetical protein E4H31_02690 [Dehalococcoidia bacterium]